ncbi:MAG: hypothetical protein J6X91_05145 [Bacteroidales bacterium]|nr:hypothetical protein [Bacteroidales bacterium]
MKKTISILCAAALILASCGSKKAEKAEKAESRPAIENSKKTEKAQKTSNSEAEKIEQARKEMRELKKEYDALLIQVTKTPDPIERERISDRMKAIDQKAERLSDYLLKTTGFPF